MFLQLTLLSRLSYFWSLSNEHIKILHSFLCRRSPEKNVSCVKTSLTKAKNKLL